MEVTRQKYLDYLSKHFERIGGGAYSFVYSKPGWDKVIKVGHWDAWPDYALWAQKEGWDATFAPKVFAFKQYNGFYVAIVERLIDTLHTPCDVSKCDLTQAFKYAKWSCNSWSEDKPENYQYPPLLDEFLEKMKRIIRANDVYHSNCMFRADGQLVITDPTCSATRSSIKRLKHGSQIAA